jgi:hypothetical protein
MGVDANQWACLVAYWFEWETKKKIDQLTYARGVIVNVSKYGCGGKAEVETFQPFFF